MTAPYAVTVAGTSTAVALGAAVSTGTATYVAKTADEVVNNSAAFQDDDHLFAAVAAGAVYEMTGLLIYDAAAAADLKAQFTLPAGATMDWVLLGPGLGVGAAPMSLDISARTAAGSAPLGANGVGTRLGAILRARLVVAATPGTLRLQWAQNTADPTAATMRAGSYLRLERMG